MRFVTRDRDVRVRLTTAEQSTRGEPIEIGKDRFEATLGSLVERDARPE